MSRDHCTQAWGLKQNTLIFFTLFQWGEILPIITNQSEKENADNCQQANHVKLIITIDLFYKLNHVSDLFWHSKERIYDAK